MRTHTLVLIALALLAAPALPAADTTVWRIGKFDHASVEFHGREADTPVHFDFYAHTHPGSDRVGAARRAGSPSRRHDGLAHRQVRPRLGRVPWPRGGHAGSL